MNLSDEYLEQFEYFVLLNSGIRGPFYPSYWELIKGPNWFEIFQSYLNEETVQVGLSINCQLQVHVQSMLVMYNKIGFKIARIEFNKYDIDSHHYLSKYISIRAFEVGISQSILENNYNIASLLAVEKGIDFRKRKTCSIHLDPWHSKWYMGMDIHPYESIFIKTNREDFPRDWVKFTEWMNHKNRAKWLED